MAAPVRTNQVNQVIRHPRTTFGAVCCECKEMLCLSRRSRIHPELPYQFISAFPVCSIYFLLFSLIRFRIKF